MQINTGRVFALKNVRIFYTKKGRMKFVSHLDMNRFMSRMIKKTDIPIWHTEGFHPHPYIAFALPLSLGFESEYEILDIRLTDDSYPLEKIVEELNSVFPEYVRAFSVAEPITKVGKIGFADFTVTFSDNGELNDSLKAFLNSTEIIVEKKTKKGKINEIDLAPKIKSYTITDDGDTTLKITLPAGSEDNLNPELLIKAFFERCATIYSSYQITRTMIYDSQMNKFV